MESSVSVKVRRRRSRRSARTRRKGVAKVGRVEEETDLKSLVGFDSRSETIDCIPESVVVEPGLKESGGVAGCSELKDVRERWEGRGGGGRREESAV